MTRFISPNLAGLPPMPAIETLDFDGLLNARLADLAARFTAAGAPDMAAVLALRSEPLNLEQRTAAFFEMLTRGRVNDAVRANMIATSTGLDLDHVVATNYGVARLPLVDAPRPFLTNSEDWEDDDFFRARAIASLEARSGAGPEGAYVYQALEMAAPNDVLDAACYGEEDGARYASGTLVLAPEVLVVVLARSGDGTPSPAMLAAVLGQLNKEEVRPIGDKVTVEPAIVAPYAISVRLRIAPGLSRGPIEDAARVAIQAYATERHAIGLIVQPAGIADAAKVEGVRELFILSPATDLDPGSKGAGYCTGITIVSEYAMDTWR